MREYHDLLESILARGTKKPPARAGMPSTLSLFGYQCFYDLQDGFPLLTTKRINFYHIVTELLWFLRGDTNIKYLVDNGCNIWNEDAYNYYLKLCNKYNYYTKLDFDEFVNRVKLGDLSSIAFPPFENYKYGDCGKQYGWLWRNWNGVDQIHDLVKGLENNPLGRRHILTAWNPETLDEMALNACHALSQFNCRPLSFEERKSWWFHKFKPNRDVVDYLDDNDENMLINLDQHRVPKYYLDCQMYQRSADVFLGVPYNIASYALLTSLLAKICDMIPGRFTHTFGDVHIYDDHMDQVREILSRAPLKLPTLTVLSRHPVRDILPDHYEKYLVGRYTLDDFIMCLDKYDFTLHNYVAHDPIKAKLSTGLK